MILSKCKSWSCTNRFWNIRPFGDSNLDEAAYPLFAVVFVEFFANPSRMDTHNRIEERIIVRTTAKHLQGNCSFFNLVVITLQFLLNAESQKLHGALRCGKR